MNGGQVEMVLVKSEDNQDLDMEWVALIQNARSLGFSKDDVRKVLLCLTESKTNDIQETAV
ncbi:anti-repressor SinI family protein [Paenibacillus sp. FSL H8-0548]|uniref:anti-repressor SinI family protein n=1 Tax=Paenibacillus sp. FSL H8-0548 TaxID=1920422 RepID=UPI00117D3A5B